MKLRSENASSELGHGQRLVTRHAHHVVLDLDEGRAAGAPGRGSENETDRDQAAGEHAPLTG